MDEIIESIRPEPAEDVGVGLRYTVVRAKDRIDIQLFRLVGWVHPLKNAGNLTMKNLAGLARS